MDTELDQKLTDNPALQALVKTRQKLTRLYGLLSVGSFALFCVILVMLPDILGQIVPGTGYLSFGMVLVFLALMLPVALAAIYAHQANGVLAKRRDQIIKDIRND